MIIELWQRMMPQLLLNQVVPLRKSFQLRTLNKPWDANAVNSKIVSFLCIGDDCFVYNFKTSYLFSLTSIMLYWLEVSRLLVVANWVPFEMRCPIFQIGKMLGENFLKLYASKDLAIIPYLRISGRIPILKIHSSSELLFHYSHFTCFLFLVAESKKNGTKGQDFLGQFIVLGVNSIYK